MVLFETISLFTGLLAVKKALSKFEGPPSLNVDPKFFEKMSRILSSNFDENLFHFPAVLIDLEALDENISLIRNGISSHPQTTIRVASKSLRVPFLLERILSSGPPFKGLMCFAVEEAEFLSSLGFDDFLIAYPSQQKFHYRILRNLHEKEKKKVTIVVDDRRSIEELNEFFIDVDEPFPLLLEFDCSFRLFNGLIHIGGRRSPIRTLDHLVELIEFIRSLKFVRLQGFMIYESHVAGIGDWNPVNFWLNPFIRFVKRRSIPQIREIRRQIHQLCLKYNLKLFNGGGTGSFYANLSETSILTEITVGSAFFQPHLFDFYQQNSTMMKHFGSTFVPSCYFALPVVRISDFGQWITCSGGGYVASGRPGWDKIPLAVYPLGLSIDENEGSGEVQTPLKIDRNNVDKINQFINEHRIIYFRHAKGGEIAERFNEFLLVSGENLVEVVKTYRGYGKCFF